MSVTKATTWRGKRLPKLGHGEGGWAVDRDRDRLLLRHAVKGGKAHTEYGKTPAECIAKRDARRNRAGLDVAGAPRTLVELFDRWIGSVAGLSNVHERTADVYRWAARRIGETPYGNLDPVTMTVADVNELLAFMKADLATMPKVKSVLNKAMAYAVDKEWRASNPVASANRIYGRKSGRGGTLHHDEQGYVAARRLFLAEPSTEHALFATMMLAGLRPGEALALRWDHVSNVIAVELTMEVTGNVTSRLKTDHHNMAAHRKIPVTSELRTILEREREAQAARGIVSEFCFTAADGSTFVRHQMGPMARHIAERLGTDYVTPNGYRHSFASWMADKGMGAPEGARLMGHSSTDMWNKVYVHVNRNTDEIDLDRFM